MSVCGDKLHNTAPISLHSLWVSPCLLLIHLDREPLFLTKGATKVDGRKIYVCVITLKTTERNQII